ncbi:cytochrome c3 family protein [Bacteroidota bacterium]
MIGNRTVITVIFIMLAVPVFAQISPGKLSESHAHLEGLSNCTKCHLLGEKASNEKCLDCHKEIVLRIKEQKGYHSSPEVRANDCIKCHSEHHGRTFQMIHFEADNFDHALTGYNLQGAHKEQSCRNCHKSEFIADPQLKQRSSTYLGLKQSCLSCHSDKHQGTLSSNCLSCHDFKVFKPASKFEHDNTRFKLLGKHAGLDCKKCHKVSIHNGNEMQEFAGVSFENCTNCHKDVHDDKFGQNCIQCHSEESFQKIRKSGNFNHSLTNYPLKGKHQLVACASCHKSQYTDPIKYNLCSDCHSDYHKKQFSRQGISPDCSDCHSILGFERSEFTIERHNKGEFVLEGAHLATPCFDCHKKNNKWSFREIGKVCIDCHKNIHEPYLDKKYYPQASCMNCHNSNTWSEIDFDHSKTNFTLEGAHLRQACRSCHFREGEGGIFHQELSQLSSGCISCHKDVHNGQFGEIRGSECLKCHDYFDWSAGRFDHDQTAFKLIGKHIGVACIKCHKPVVTAQITYTQYKLNNFSCESCH